MVAQNAVDAIGGGGSRNPRIFGRKKLTMSDYKSRQNHFLFPDENVRNFILPQLNKEEMDRAHLPLGINLNDDLMLDNLWININHLFWIIVGLLVWYNIYGYYLNIIYILFQTMVESYYDYILGSNIDRTFWVGLSIYSYWEVPALIYQFAHLLSSP